MDRYFLIYKPFQTLSRFTSGEGKRTLKDQFDVPVDCYPVGRLDYDSEGLLLLTNDASLNKRLLHPDHAHEREYWVQVEGTPGSGAIDRLQQGVTITVNGKPYRTKRCRAALFATDPVVPDRVPPIRFRATIPTGWIRLVLTEGKNRQVRKMTASVGLPTLRLIRYRIGGLSLDDLRSGALREMKKQEIYPLLFTFPS